MRGFRRALGSWVVSTGVLWAVPAPGQPPAAATAQPGDAPRDVAVDLFRRGMALLRAGDVERALDLLLQSRRLFPSKGNTLNAAICLERLGRLDEALVLYEEAVSVFGGALDPEDRDALPAVMAGLRARVGTVDVSGNVTGAVILIDGRERGRLPLTTPLRVLPGQRQLRVVKDGYQSWEGRVQVTQGEITRVDARLEALEASGGLRVEATGLDAGGVTVDGVEVGDLPWEGTLAPGRHVVSVRGGEHGSGPVLAVVLAGQTALVRLRVGLLAPALTVRASPETAELVLDGVPLGRGSWQGRLPVGRHTLEAREDGYRPGRVSLSVEGGRAPPPLQVRLEVDPDHPRWPKRGGGTLVVGLVGGAAAAASLRSTAEESCPGHCPTAGIPTGTLLLVGAAWELPSRLALGVELGYASLQRTFARELPGPLLQAPDGATAAVTYALDDLLRVHGPLAGLTLGYSQPLVGALHFRARLRLAAWFVRATDTITGVASTRDGTVAVSLAGVNDEVSAIEPLVLQELGAHYALGEWRVGGSLGAIMSGSRGPTFERGPLVAGPPCPATVPTSAGCAPESSALEREQAYRAFVGLTLLGFVEVTP